MYHAYDLGWNECSVFDGRNRGQAKTGSGPLREIGSHCVERHTVRARNQFAVNVFVSEHIPKMKVMTVKIQT